MGGAPILHHPLCGTGFRRPYAKLTHDRITWKTLNPCRSNRLRVLRQKLTRQGHSPLISLSGYGSQESEVRIQNAAVVAAGLTGAAQNVVGRAWNTSQTGLLCAEGVYEVEQRIRCQRLGQHAIGPE